jgi:hypothetical protein
MAKKLTVDQAFRWMHEKALVAKVVWNDDCQVCCLQIFDGLDENPVILTIHNGCIEEDMSEFESIMDAAVDNRPQTPQLTLVK